MSVDTICDEDEVTRYPTEFLNSLTPSGCPPHELILKIGVPVMLLRNLDPPMLCNGTRLIATKLLDNVVVANIMGGQYANDTCFIPRIPIIPADLPFRFKRLQFPLRMCYAMTINKSQGQTINTVGLCLSPPVFSHGQLYVAVSRVRNPKCLFFLTEKHSKTVNVVYREALISPSAL